MKKIATCGEIVYDCGSLVGSGRLGKLLNSACGVTFRQCRIASICLAVIGFALIGCNQSAIKLYPVRGQVFFKDQPAEGAQISFLPTGEGSEQFRGPRPMATVSADGSFELQTDPYGIGAPPGDYAVLITWFPPRDENPNANPKNKLPNKYGDPSNPVLKATVKEGENVLEPFKLTP